MALNFRKWILVICGIAIAMAILLWYIPVWPLRPVFLVRPRNQDICLEKSFFCLTTDEADLLCAALSSASEIFVRIDNYIFVNGSLYFDKELCWNYTSKSAIKLRDTRYNLQDSNDGGPMLWVEEAKSLDVTPNKKIWDSHLGYPVALP